mgnify:CR=1 FL=1
MFTGKNEIQFKDWYNNKYLKDKKGFVRLTLELFYELPPEMQLGVYLAYADSLGYEIEKSRYFDEEMNVTNLYEVDIMDYTLEISWLYVFYNENELEAYKEALKKFDEIINEQLK